MFKINGQQYLFMVLTDMLDYNDSVNNYTKVEQRVKFLMKKKRIWIGWDKNQNHLDFPTKQSCPIFMNLNIIYHWK